MALDYSIAVQRLCLSYPLFFTIWVFLLKYFMACSYFTKKKPQNPFLLIFIPKFFVERIKPQLIFPLSQFTSCVYFGTHNSVKTILKF